MNDNTLDAISRLEAKVQLLAELIDKKNLQINGMIENLKKLEGYKLGSKETADKIDEHVKKQLKEVEVLVVEQKITKEIANLIQIALNGTLNQAKNAFKEAEALFFTKQGEIIFAKQEAEQYVVIKESYKNNIRELQKTPEINSIVQSSKPVTIESEKQERIRPDKNPNTKLGRTSMRVVEARKKPQEDLEMPQENKSKKRGRKPKTK